MPVDVVCLSNATSRRIVTRPGAPAPRDACDHAADRAAAQDQDVVDDETQQKIDVVKQRLIKYFGYNETSATDVLNYVASIFARGDTKQDE